MKVLLLAAGTGSRLEKYTQDCPKALVKLHNKPLLEYQLEVLQELGLKDITVVIGYKGEQIRNYIANHPKWSTLKITFVENDNPEVQGTAYSVWLASSGIENQDHLHLHCDLVFDKEVLLDLLASPHPDALVIDRKIKLNGRNQRVLLNGNKIVRMQNTPLEGAVGKCVGLAKISAKSFSYLMKKARQQFVQGNLKQSYYSLIGQSIETVNFFVVDAKDYKLIEINTTDQLLMAERGWIRNEY